MGIRWQAVECSIEGSFLVVGERVRKALALIAPKFRLVAWGIHPDFSSVTVWKTFVHHCCLWHSFWKKGQWFPATTWVFSYIAHHEEPQLFWNSIYQIRLSSFFSCFSARFCTQGSADVSSWHKSGNLKGAWICSKKGCHIQCNHFFEGGREVLCWLTSHRLDHFCTQLVVIASTMQLNPGDGELLDV